MSRNAPRIHWRAALCLFIALLGNPCTTAAERPSLRPQTPASSAKSRVVIVQDARAMREFQPVPEVVEEMIPRGLRQFTGKATAREAWLSLVKVKDVVGLKVHSAPGASSGTRPAVVAAVIRGLRDAGLPATNLIIWDRRLSDLKAAGYVELAESLGVRVAGAEESGYDESVFYEKPLLGSLIYGDHEFGKKGDQVGKKSFVSKLVTRDMTRIIVIAPLLNHNHVNVAGQLYSLAFGSVDNTMRFEHNRNACFEAVPDIYNLAPLGDRVALNITDGLICQYEGEQRSLMHYSVPLAQLRFSKDPVALDVMSVIELYDQRKRAPNREGQRLANPDWEIFQNATLIQLGTSDARQIRTEFAP